MSEDRALAETNTDRFHNEVTLIIREATRLKELTGNGGPALEYALQIYKRVQATAITEHVLGAIDSACDKYLSRMEALLKDLK
jgi:hypothetical protein